MLTTRTDRISVRFIVHRYDDGTPWLGIESTDGKVLPMLADGFFRLELKAGTTWEEAGRIAEVLDAVVESLAVTRFLPAVNERPF